MQRTTVLSSWGRAIRRALDRAGVDSAALFAEAGLDIAALDDPNARYPLEQTTRLWGLSVQATGDEAFGLSVASQVNATTFHALGYALQASNTLREAFERMVRYFRLVTDAADLEFFPEGEDYCFRIRPAGAVMPAPESIDAFISIFLRFCRSHLGSGFAPRRVTLRRLAPASAAGYERVLRCPLEFGAAENAIWFPRWPFDQRLEGANPELARHNDEIALRYLAHHDKENLLARVRAVLTELLPIGVPAAEQVADSLHLSLRSLQRKLAEEGSSYEALLNETRRELAQSYLQDRRYSIGEITFLLGFSDTSSFTRAFRRWNGCSPSQFRERAG
ncbi:AraC family transcriptional regulator [Solimonas sp. SE-A11]|uniref:AraC family transcriptional regulator n=1 Tax=Solimonas sp. SE-A11 TaxID=3054954 RepID=UPI00259D2DD4|nr:AraC family transcriptional regulator [Solimonas sp. SE-A11]MDM4770260.1 AraC family transcriptional regulator [Solimonas sp. SE-A11]